jgi:hypothetical protein
VIRLLLLMTFLRHLYSDVVYVGAKFGWKVFGVGHVVIYFFNDVFLYIKGSLGVCVQGVLEFHTLVE